MTAGLFTHLHHGAFLEWTEDLENRIREIEHNKLPDERVLRTALIKQVVPEGLPRKWRKLVKTCYDGIKEGRGRKAREALSRLNCVEFHKLVCHPRCQWSVNKNEYHDIFWVGKDVAVLLGRSWENEWK